MSKPIKPLGHKNYGSIPHLKGSRLGPGDHHIEVAQGEIATKKARDGLDLVIVQEKLDGSNVGVAKIDGEIVPLQRSGYHCNTSPHLMHRYFANWVMLNHRRFNALLNDGERICGEWLYQAHGTKYDLPHEPFVVFDIMEGMERKTYHEFLTRILPLDFVPPRLIHMGGGFSVKKAIEAIKESGHGAIDPVEGAVWRVERSGKVDFLCKYVQPNKEDGKYFASPVINSMPKTELYFEHKDIGEIIIS